MKHTSGWQKSYERDVIHPAAIRWLLARGYTYEYEVRMPAKGRIDFKAANSSGDQLFLECKTSASRLNKSINQLKGYARQCDDRVRLAIGLPFDTITDGVRKICQDTQCELAILDVSGIMSVSLHIPIELRQALWSKAAEAHCQSANHYIWQLLERAVKDSHA